MHNTAEAHIPNAPRLTVLVPCYRDALGLQELHRRLTAVCSSLGCTYEILLVDDGSPDATWPAIWSLAQMDPLVRGIKLSRNHGHQLAVTAGLANARGERVLIIDSDLQDPPELLPEMMRLMDEGADNVYGQRLSRKGVPAWKKACYRAYYRILTALAGCSIPEDTGDFRLISKRVVDLVNQMPEHYRFLRGMISWLGFKQVALQYHRDARFAGESGYTLTKLFRIAVDGITSFSVQPLRLATMLGFLFALFCIAGIIQTVICHFIYGTVVAGWTSLISLMMLIASLQFFVLGMIGEYIGRIFIEQKHRPLFIVAETTPQKTDAPLT